ncbi:acetolactate synthase small subunit [Parasphingorhabdus sp.]|uniref:acetolactate synthase small subunit n=1 Tax=Parasphingorhabdus sp. TaxID=2709688 RepID=UPI002F9378EA
MHINEEQVERHVLAVLVDNEAGILARIAGMFTARGYNIESLTVADISADHAISRITIATSGPPHVIEQIIAQLDRLVPVHSVRDLTESGPHVQRELALVKVAGKGEARIEAMRLADIYRARVVDATTESFVFEITGNPGKIETFISLMREVGLVEVGRTGVVAIGRGPETA